MLNKDRFLQNAKKYNIEAENIFTQIDKYAKLLIEYNNKVNLTAITQAEDIENKHFIDSLLLASLPQISGSIVDVGTGAGFPGIVLKMYKPQIELTLMEPTGKRVDFLKFVCSELGLKDVNIVKERAEEAARKNYREKYDVAVARAVAKMSTLSEYCLPLVKKGGCFLAMKGASGQEELKQALPAIAKLGGKCDENTDIKQFVLPDESTRAIIICKKISQTPSVYPRNGGKIAKAPLV